MEEHGVIYQSLYSVVRAMSAVPQCHAMPERLRRSLSSNRASRCGEAAHAALLCIMTNAAVDEHESRLMNQLSARDVGTGHGSGVLWPAGCLRAAARAYVDFFSSLRPGLPRISSVACAREARRGMRGFLRGLRGLITLDQGSSGGSGGSLG